MLKHPRRCLLDAVTGEGGWIHPYSDPFTCYRDGGGSGNADGGGDGDGDGDDGTDDADSDDDHADGDDGDGDDDKDGEGDDDQLGAKGLKALREVRRENRRLKAQLRERGDGDASGRKASAKDGKGSKDDGQDDAEAIREQARADARAEVWNERVEAAAIAAAAGRLANPSRVAALLGEDLADIPKDDKGRPDKEAISELIDDLLETDPYLAASAKGDSGRRFQGDADSGARKKTKKAAGSLDEAIAAKLAKSGG